MSEEQDLQGKVFVVTGANSGIGFVAAQNFASRGASVALVCRDATRGQQALETIRDASSNQNLRLFLADFSLLSSVAAVADELLAAYASINVLCNNAGGTNVKRMMTAEGFEKTFVTNHLSGFLLTIQLLPALLKAAETAPARVVYTSSLGHKNSPLDFDDLNLERDYSTMKAYGRSKLMNLLTARELQRRYGEKNLVASSYHPGGVRTAIWSKGGLLAKLLGFVLYPFMVSVEKGADTLIWLASSQEQASLHADGNYFYERQVVSVAPYATAAAAEKLWQISADLIADSVSRGR